MPRAEAPDWPSNVSNYLFQGFGVEDIAILQSCNVEHVRLEVKILREEGVLAQMWGQK